MWPYVHRGQQLPPAGVAGYAPNSALGIRALTRWMGRWPVPNLLVCQFAKAAHIELPG